MTLRELVDASLIWHPDSFVKILRVPAGDLKPESMLLRSAYSVLGGYDVVWFSRDIIALR